MRTLNLAIIAGVIAFALLLLCVAFPTFGERPLAHWALNVGAYSTVLMTSLIYLLIQLLAPTYSNKTHAIILTTYILASATSLVGGGSWGVVGHVMETERVGFIAGLQAVIPILVILYSVTLIITFCTLFYVLAKANAQRVIDSGRPA